MAEAAKDELRGHAAETAYLDRTAYWVRRFTGFGRPATAPELVGVVVRAAEVTNEAIGRLTAPSTLVDPWLELTRLGKQGGQVHRRLSAELTAATSDPGLLARHVAVAHAMRRVVEAFDEVADALQTVAVRES